MKAVALAVLLLAASACLGAAQEGGEVSGAGLGTDQALRRACNTAAAAAATGRSSAAATGRSSAAATGRSALACTRTLAEPTHPN